MPYLGRKALISCLFSVIWVMNFAKGNLVVCHACRTDIAELIKVWYEYIVEATLPPSLLMKQNSRSQSFCLASWAVKFQTALWAFLHTAVKTKDRSPPVSNLFFFFITFL